MKQLIPFLLFAFLFGCSNENKTVIETKKVVIEQPVIEFTKYSTIKEMLIAAGDFNEEQGTLKMLSKDDKTVHVQVSKEIYDGDQEESIIKQTKRDIVYVAFQAFAHTDITELTITSVPIKGKKKYVNKYKLTVTISRENAKSILKKYLNTENFQDLYQLNETLWLPNNNFDMLKFKNLDAVFDALKN